MQPLLALPAAGFTAAPVAHAAAWTASRAAISLMAAPNKGAVRGTRQFTGKVVPTRGKNSRALKKKEEEEEELSIKELLSRYGVIALLFHFTVWITCLSSIFALFTFGLDANSLLPAWLLPEDAEGAAGAAGVAGRAAATLALVEAIGPARMALTVAATPKVSERAREFAVVRDVESFAASAWEKVTGRAES